MNSARSGRVHGPALFSLLSLLHLLQPCLALPPSLRAAEGAKLIVSLPMDYQVHQRQSRTEGRIPITLHFPAGTAPERDAVVEARLVPAAGAKTTDSWQKLGEQKAGAAEFKGELSHAPAGGWYRLELRVKTGDTLLGQAEVQHVGVGEIFVIAGQSNSANHGEGKQQPKSGLVVNFSGQRWAPAEDPQPGASGSGGSFIPALGDALVAVLKVPVGVVCAGVGATSVREWLPRGTRFPNPPTLTGNVTAISPTEWEAKGSLFSDFAARVKELGRDGFRAVLWHQGESDAHQADPARTLSGDRYRDYLSLLIQETRREAGWACPWFVALVSYHAPDDAGSPEIRGAQLAVCRRGLALEGPDSDALVGDLRDGGGKGIHFSAKGLEEHGRGWADKLEPWLEQELDDFAVARARAGAQP